MLFVSTGQRVARDPASCSKSRSAFDVMAKCLGGNWKLGIGNTFFPFLNEKASKFAANALECG